MQIRIRGATREVSLTTPEKRKLADVSIILQALADNGDKTAGTCVEGLKALVEHYCREGDKSDA